MKKLDKLSVFISLVLRHKPEAAGITLDEHGWANVEELLACYEFFKEGSTIIDSFEKLPYSELAGNFIDKFGVQWGFMTEQ